MPRAIAIPVRQEISQRRQQGQSIACIAEQMQMSFWTVRCLVRQLDPRGTGPLTTQYHQCGQSQTQYEATLRQETVQMKTAHTKWGAQFIRLQLQKRYPSRSIPAVRTLQKYFKEARLSPPPKSRRSVIPRTRAKEVHEVWQMDACERLELADGSGACWLRVCDEWSGAILATALFPPRGMDASAFGSNPTAIAGLV